MFLLTYGICLMLISSVICDECDKHGILLYEDLGCTPEYKKDRQCPVKYNCKGLGSDGKVCHFKGKIYQSGEEVDSSLSYPACEVGCSCRPGIIRSGFTCAILDCPEWLGAPLHHGCYRNYSLESCCSVGQVCPPFDKIETCVVGNETYREGEKFYPEGTCFDCVCQKGFRGKFEEPFCRRRNCGQQLRKLDEIQRYCAPVYTKQELLCCPSDWICSSGSELIQGTPESDESCKFGVQTLKVGQYFEMRNVTINYGRIFDKIKCDCVIPPLVKCKDV